MQLPSLKWAPSPNVSARTAAVDLVVLHDCEGSYESAVSWFSEKRSQVSAHLVLKEDGTEATQCVSFDRKAWHACDFNSRSIGVEMGGFASRGYPEAEWQTAANVLAYLLRAYGIPCQWAQHGQGPGFASHFDLGVAGGHHFDPTTDPLVWAGFVARVERTFAAGGFPSGWGRGLPSSPPVQVTTPVGPTLSISAAQRALNAAGYRPALKIDGQLGPKTRDALAKYQSSKHLFASGTLDAATIAALLDS